MFIHLPNRQQSGWGNIPSIGQRRIEGNCEIGWHSQATATTSKATAWNHSK